ncbi:MAG: hypothetical protein Fur0037_04770 [Planctomycetota bacterium]
MIPLPQDPQGAALPGQNVGNVENVHPVALAALALLSVAALMVPRRRIPVPLLILMCFIPSGQRLLLFTLDFSFLRILLIACWARLLLRSELRRLSWNHLDRAILAWAAVQLAAGTILGGSVGSAVNGLGVAFDSIGTYFLFRQVIRTHEDLDRIATCAIWIGAPVLAAFAVEYATHRNVFSVFGGVPEITFEREGRLRCQGAFAHPILAGCFWGLFLPLFAGLWFRRKERGLAVLGICIALAIVVLCASSTPVLSILAACLSLAAWFVRPALRWVRWMAVFAVVGLHLVMKAPVWHLISRIDVAGGSTGAHRYRLIDAAIRNLSEWAAIGTPSTEHWGWGLGDVTNQYVAEGVRGGAVRLAVFLCAISLAFAGVSRAMRSPARRGEKIAIWALGTVLFVHCVNFVAVSYFGQITELWYLTLAAIGSLGLVPGAKSGAAVGPTAH